jgi:hypothetical protein
MFDVLLWLFLEGMREGDLIEWYLEERTDAGQVANEEDADILMTTARYSLVIRVISEWSDQGP